jgi:hypothetical protein
MIAHAVQDGFDAGSTFAIEVVVFFDHTAAVVTGVQTEINVLAVVVHVFHHPVPALNGGMDIGAVDKLQCFIVIAQEFGTLGRVLNHERLHVLIQSQNAFNFRKNLAGTLFAHEYRVIGLGGHAVIPGYDFLRGPCIILHND